MKKKSTAADKKHAPEILSSLAKRVYAEIKKVPKGRVLTYKELAAKCGKPKAIRAIATIVGKNQNPVTIPCHRIVPSDYSIGQYTYKGKRNVAKKIALLKSEGVLVRNGKILN